MNRIYSASLGSFDRSVFERLSFRDFFTLSALSKRLNVFFHEEMYARALAPVKEKLDPKKIEAITEEEIAQFLRALNAAKWGPSRMVALEKVPFCALRAFKERRISYLQFGTALHFWSALKTYPKRQVRYLRSTTAEFKRVIESTLHVKESTDWFYPERSHSGGELLDAAQRERFYSLIEKKKPSEQGVLLVKRESNTKSPLIEAIRERRNVNTLMIGRERDQEWVVIPSMSVMQACFAAQVYKKALFHAPVFIVPTIGLSTLEEMYYFETRPVALDSPWEKCPKKVDGYLVVNAHCVAAHDVYHSQLINYIPTQLKKVSRLWIDVLRAVVPQDNGFDADFLKAVENILLDSDVVDYYIKYGIKKEADFDLNLEMKDLIQNILFYTSQRSSAPRELIDSGLLERICKKAQEMQSAFTALGIRHIDKISCLNYPHKEPFISIELV